MASSSNNEPANSRGDLAIAVIGCGYWGPNLARNFYRIPSCNLKAVSDPDPERLADMETRFPGVACIADSSKVLSDPEIDAVVVATPVRYHYEIAKAALVSGKHVLIEKPMASSAAECEELNQIAAKNGLTLMVGHTFLYSEAVNVINEKIISGDIGDVLYINAQRLNLGLFQKDINVAWDLAPHDLSIILHLLRDTPETINCQGNAHISPHVEDVTNMSLTFPGNRFATVQSSWIEPRKVRQMTIVGTKGMIVYDDVQQLEKIRIFDTRVDKPPHYASFGDFHYSYHYGDSYCPRLDQREPLRTQCEHFLDCITKGTRPLTSGEDGLRIVKLLEKSAESLKANGIPISVDVIENTESASISNSEPLRSLTSSKELKSWLLKFKYKNFNNFKNLGVASPRLVLDLKYKILKKRQVS